MLRAGRELDTPDQRLTQDVQELAASMGRVCRVALAAPLKVAWYTVLTARLVGAGSAAACFGFFGLGAVLQGSLLRPVARLVAEQERREGLLRQAHARAHDRREEVALSSGQAPERRVLRHRLAEAAGNQRALAFRRWALAGVSKGLEYAGALVNYLLVAGAVFWAGAAAPRGPGDRAALVSNSSFATLMLIYSLTQVLGTAKDLSAMAGLAFRVAGLLRSLRVTRSAVGRHPAPPADPAADPAAGARGGAGGRPWTWARDLGGPAGPRPRPESFDSAASSPRAPSPDRAGSPAQVPPPGLGGAMLVPPARGTLRGAAGRGGGARGGAAGAWAPGVVEVSAHSVSVPDAGVFLAGVFPDRAPWPAGRGLSAVVTVQCSAVDLAEDRRRGAGAPEASAEMDRMLGVFLELAGRTQRWMASRGWWLDAVDPVTGQALLGAPGARYSEVRGARALLGYATRESGPVSMLSHPEIGTRAYPATMFTDAPPEAVREALSQALDVDLAGAAPPGGAPGGRGGAAAGEVLALEGISYDLPDGRVGLRGLSVAVRRGGSLLIRGPSGCGKTTLLRCLAGLSAFSGGRARAPPPGAAMFLPQRTVMAPPTGRDGRSSLREQVLYPGGPGPGSGAFGDAEALEAIREAGLGGLLERAGGDLDWRANFDEGLSPGEQQRVALARVLLRRPEVCFLDEATNAVPADAEEAVYAALAARGVARVTVGHGGALDGLHEVVLVVRGDGAGGFDLLPGGAGAGR